jgi:hypothetical protein
MILIKNRKVKVSLDNRLKFNKKQKYRTGLCYFSDTHIIQQTIYTTKISMCKQHARRVIQT